MCLLLLILAVSSHLLSSAKSTVCWVHLWRDSVHCCWWKLSVETVSQTLSLFQQQWAQESVSFAEGTAVRDFRNLMFFTLRLTAEFHLTWMLQEQSLGSGFARGCVKQPRCRFCAPLVLSTPICASLSYLLSANVTLRKVIFQRTHSCLWEGSISQGRDALHQRQCSANATSEINFSAISWCAYNQGHVSCSFLPLLFLVKRTCLTQT